MENLSRGKAMLAARASSRDLGARRELTIEEDDDAVRLVAEAITPAVSAATSKVLHLERLLEQLPPPDPGEDVPTPEK